MKNLTIILSIFVSMLWLNPAAAQSALTPAGLVNLAQQPGGPSAKEWKDIEQFVAEQCDILQEGAGDVDRVAETLGQPLNVFEATAQFRTGYSDILLPKLSPIIERGQPHAVTVAVRLLGHLQTEPAIRKLNELADHRAGDSPARAMSIRLWAAKSLTHALDEGLEKDVQLPIIRAMKRAGQKETNPWVLSRQLDVLEVIHTDQSRAARVDVLEEQIKFADMDERLRIRQIQTIADDGQTLLLEYLGLSQTQKAPLGDRLIPFIVTVFDTCNAQFDTISDPKLRKEFGQLIYKTEIMLGQVSKQLRLPVPDTHLSTWWNEGNYKRFEHELKLLKTALAEKL